MTDGPPDIERREERSHAHVAGTRTHERADRVLVAIDKALAEAELEQ